MTANANAIDGVHIVGGSDGAALENVTALGNLNDGVYLGSLVDHVTGSTFSLNHAVGIDLEQTGATLVQKNTVASNSGVGILVNNNSGSALVGSTDLSLNAGNIVTGNGSYGIQATGIISVAGNVVSGQAAFGVAGIYVRSGASATSNIVFNNYNGIVTDSGSPMTGNRIYHNANVGLIGNNNIISGNVIYSNSVGMVANSGTVQNNLVYANTSQGIEVAYQNTLLINNTVYQTAGDAVNVAGFIFNLQLRNNILWDTAGYDINVPSTSQNGFVSDYNLLYVTGARTSRQLAGRGKGHASELAFGYT